MVMIADEWPAVREVIEAAQHAHSEGVAAYICYMAVRLIECQRILKPTGSLYLHCDHTANSYLRALLDSIFGPGNFRNEIVWHYGKMSNTSRNFPRNHDTILRYTKSDGYTFNPLKGGESEYKERYKRYLTNNTVLYGAVKDSTDKLVLGRIRKVSKQLGRPLTSTDVLFDFDHEFKIQSDVIYVPIIKGNSVEKTNYPTQKPITLYEKLVESSSNPGDVVLDPFAGCATTLVAAEGLDRHWIACDISPRALTVLRRQFAKKGWAIDGEAAVADSGQVSLAFVDVTIVGPHDILERDHSADPIRSVNALPKRKFKVPASDMPEPEMKALLADVAGYQCWACGFAVRDTAGNVVESVDHFHLDHIEPKSQGGSNVVHNRALLCAPCNMGKSAKRVPLKTLRDEPEVATRRASYGHDDYPVDIDIVQTEAMFRWSAWRTAEGLDTPSLALG